MANVLDVFFTFLRLGLTSFGGPVAHLGYFREALVIRRKWLDDAAYAEIVALCQFLPGPASSQVGFAIGRLRAGLPGAVAAFLGFTAPSFLMMAVLAVSLERIDPMAAAPFIRGLQIAAVAIVLHALSGMARSLCPDWPRRIFAALIGLALIVAAQPLAQIAAIAIGLAVGPLLTRDAPLPPRSSQPAHGRAFAIACGVAFVAGLAALPVIAARDPSGALAIADAFYRAGALVFGGGHVVLPLLETEMTGAGWMTQSDVLAGYAAAQALPGPLFALAAFLGAGADAGPGGMAGAALATVAIFTPGFLILLAAQPFWAVVRAMPVAQRSIAGANAAVVGVLGAAFVDPIARTGAATLVEMAIALALFALLRFAKASPVLVVAIGAGAGWALTALA